MGLSTAQAATAPTAKSVSVSDLTDRDLVRLVSASSSHERDRAFNEILNRYERRVRSWCLRMVRDRERARDLAQDVFLRAYINIGSFRGDSQLSTWLYTIARNHCLNYMKRQSTATVEITESLSARLQDSRSRRMYDAVEQRQAFNFIWSTMVKPACNAVELRVLELHYGHEVPLEEITRRLALSNPTGAKAFIVNARRKITAYQRRRPPASA